MQLVVTKANSLQAFGWIKRGWRIFTLQPGPFMAMSGIVLAFSLLGQMVPAASFIIVFLLPFLTAGFYQCASRVEQGEQIQAGDIFFYLSQVREYFVFIRIALVSIVLSIPLTMSAAPIVESLQSEVMPTYSHMLTFVAFLALNFMLTAFAVPAAWVSPQTPLASLIQQSFKACWINVLPLTLYGLLMLSITLISAPILVIGWLIAAAIGTISFYQMFLDFYRPVEAEITPMPNGQETLNADESDQDTLDQDTAGQAQESASSEQEIEREADQNGLESASESESEDRTDNRRD